MNIYLLQLPNVSDAWFLSIVIIFNGPFSCLENVLGGPALCAHFYFIGHEFVALNQNERVEVDVVNIPHATVTLLGCSQTSAGS